MYTAWPCAGRRSSYEAVHGSDPSWNGNHVYRQLSFAASDDADDSTGPACSSFFAVVQGDVMNGRVPTRTWLHNELVGRHQFGSNKRPTPVNPFNLISFASSFAWSHSEIVHHRFCRSRRRSESIIGRSSGKSRTGRRDDCPFGLLKK